MRAVTVNGKHVFNRALYIVSFWENFIQHSEFSFS